MDLLAATRLKSLPGLRGKGGETKKAGPEPTLTRRRISKAAWFECCSDKGEKEGIKKRGQS
jgi:hypothetical protein